MTWSDFNNVSLADVVTFLGAYSGDRCKMEIAESTSQPVITVRRLSNPKYTFFFFFFFSSSSSPDGRCFDGRDG